MEGSFLCLVIAGAVKSFLMARISEYRAQVVSQYQTVVPREKASFEAAFDSFVEACLLQRQTEHESEQGTNNNQSTEGILICTTTCSAHQS